MTDKELLELAAKAAGYKYAKNGGYIVVDGIPGSWNPLSDDGDALRLAVKLNMTISLGVARSVAGEFSAFDEPCDYAATRRAIVRAAAEIGRNME